MLYIRVKQATKQGWINCKNGGVFDTSYPTSTLRRGRVQGGGNICPTLTTGKPNILRVYIRKKGADDVGRE